jgi:hypothetical protein
MLRLYTSEKAREKLQLSRRRPPEASPLYQIVYYSLDDLQFHWEARHILLHHLVGFWQNLNS